MDVTTLDSRAKRVVTILLVAGVLGSQPAGAGALSAVLGVALGFAVALVPARHLALRECGDSCGDEKLGIAISLIGLPVVGGVVGARSAGRAAEDALYSDIGGGAAAPDGGAGLPVCSPGTAIRR